MQRMIEHWEKRLNESDILLKNYKAAKKNASPEEKERLQPLIMEQAHEKSIAKQAIQSIKSLF